MAAAPPLRRLALLGALALGTGCLAPAIAPIHPMMASAAANTGDREVATTLGYAPAPGGGLGDSSIPGTPYAEGELRWAVATNVQLIGGLGLSFQRYFLPWPSSLSLGSKLTVYQQDHDAFALAPRVVGASAFNVLGTDPSDSSKSRSVFGTRSLGFELPLLATHTFENGWALTVQGWGRYHLLRQEDPYASPSTSGSGSGLGPTTFIPVETGHAWGAGGALQFSFPKVRGSQTRYHLFLGAERLWLTQTSATTNAGQASEPLIHLSRTSLIMGLGTTTPW